jgi:SAM-dependent methyltransferase
VRDVTRNAADLYASLASEGSARWLDRETLARDDAARIGRDLARWRRKLSGGEAEVGQPPSALATRIQARLRRARRKLATALAPLPELLHIDLGALGVKASSRVLDLGCGAGQFSLPLSQRCALALSVDLDMPRLRELRDAGAVQHLPVRPVRADAARLPLADAILDAVVCREVLEHVDEPGDVLDEIRRVLSFEGKLCVTVPSPHTERWFQWVDSRWLDMAGHVHVFHRSEMCALLERHGFRVRSVRGRNCFYSFFWFVHTLVGTRHDGTGRIQDHHVLAARIFRVWSWLGEGRARRVVEMLGNAIVPKSNVYYCEPRDGATLRA